MCVRVNRYKYILFHYLKKSKNLGGSTADKEL